MWNKILTAYGTFASQFGTAALALADLNKGEKLALYALAASGAVALWASKPRSKGETT